MQIVCHDPPVPTTSPTPSRREINRLRTHEALVTAARELGREHGLEHVTAEEIAERAGVSRRTFFNYFSGIEEVVAAGFAVALERLAEALHRRPTAEDPLLAIIEALRDEPIGADILLGWEPREPRHTAQRQMMHVRIWQHHEHWLVALLRERLGEGPDLRAESLAAAVMAIFEMVQEAWAPTAAQQPPATAVTEFNDQLLRALGHARAGWQQPEPTA